MRVLVTAGRGKTGQRVIAALQRQGGDDLSIRTLCRSPVEDPKVETILGDMDDPSARARAVAGMDLVIHYGPAMHPREVSMGTGMIDAAVAVGVPRFVFISVIHPEIDDLLNHQAKLQIEAYLINSRIDWTVLRPQHYFQNIDPKRAISEGVLAMPYPPTTRLGHVDMNDLADAAAKVAFTSGHVYATYDIASNEHLTVEDICATISRVSGKSVIPREISPADVIRHIASHQSLTPYTEEAFHRLAGYYARRGISGNANVMTWLLERKPGTFENYIARCLAGTEKKVGFGQMA